jgi:ribosomal protein S11
MKFTKFIFLLVCISCFSMRSPGAQVDSQTAASAVTGWLRYNHHPLGSSLGATVKNVESFNDTSGAPLYHVVYLEPSGFVIVSAEDQIEPIIAFVEKGHFDPSPSNPLGALINRDLPNRVAQARAQGGKPMLQAGRNSTWQTLVKASSGGAQPMGVSSGAISDIRVAPFVNTLWDQGDLPTVVTNWIWITNQINITTHFVSDPTLANFAFTSMTITNCPSGINNLSRGIMRITNGPGNPVVHSLVGGVFNIDINNGPGTTVTNKLEVFDNVIIVVTNEFGDVVANDTPVWSGITFLTNAVSGTTGGTTTTQVIFVDGFQIVVSDLKACYNYFTPPHGTADIANSVNTNNDVCGCVATAMAQLMYYFQYPVTGVGPECFTVTVNGYPVGGNLLGGDYMGGPYKWNCMPLAPDYYSLTPLQAKSVGVLTRDAGFAVNMQYTDSPEGSGAYMTNAKAALVNTFQYQNAIVNWVTNLNTGCFECGLYNMMNPNLDARLPVLLAISGDPGNHCIVVDGYGYSYGSLYSHLNMGWSGLYNAWYNLPIIDMEVAPGKWSYFWTVTQCIYNVFTNGSGEIISGRILDSSTGLPIPNTSVTAARIGGGTYTAVTDANGIYALVGVPSASTFTITVTNTGYIPASGNDSTGTSYDDGGVSGNIWGANFSLVPQANGQPPKITGQPEDQAIIFGQSATFSVSATGQLPLGFQWQIMSNGSPTWTDVSDGAGFSGSSTETLTVIQPDIAHLNGAEFQCVVTNAFGSVTSSPPAILSVNVPYLTIITLGGLAGYPGSTDGTNYFARFSSPHGIAVDSQTNIYVTDMYNHVIRKLTPAGVNWVVSTIAGQVGSWGATDGTNNQAQFNGPRGIVLDGSGNLYVADTGNNTIRKLTPRGTNWVVSTIAGLAGNAGSTDSSNSYSRFKFPMGIAMDTGGHLYVTDEGNSTIRRLTLSGTNWLANTIAGLALNPGHNDGTNSFASFNTPSGIAVDNGGNVYVADTANSTIRELNLIGANWVVSTIAGLALNPGTNDGIGSLARFNNPTGVAVDGNGNAYVADEFNNTLRWLTQTGTNWTALTVAGLGGSSGSVDGTGYAVRFNAPYGIAVGNHTNVYVTDSINNTIRGTPSYATPLQLDVKLQFLAKQKTNSAFMLTWGAVVGNTSQVLMGYPYQVQCATNLNQTPWNTWTNITATNWTGVVCIPFGLDPQMFYRLVLFQ